MNVKKIKYDFSLDNTYDTSLTAKDTVVTQFATLGYNTVIATVVLNDNSTLSCSTKVWLTQPIEIANNGGVFFEPNIYNGCMISVTNGVGHRAKIIDIDNYNMESFFEGYDETKFIEMHVTIPNFCGTKMLFDNGTEYKFCYYDLESNDSLTTVDVPMNVATYPIGQITWGLDNKSIYYRDVEKSNVPNGIKKYNIESGEIKDIYSGGNYICVVPNEKNMLAVLEEVSEEKSKLLIINTDNNAIEKTYENLPFNAPFRMLEDNDRIYVDGQLAFYSLNRKKMFYMSFTDIDLEDHMYGEADISMDGTKFVIGTWNDIKALYVVSLPNNF